MLRAIDHVQLAMPPGKENEARAFYADILGLKEVPKPPELAVRGGVWFCQGDVSVHLGVDSDYRPAQKSHIAFRCADYETLLERLKGAGADLTVDSAGPQIRRFYAFDPYGNRLEFIAD